MTQRVATCRSGQLRVHYSVYETRKHASVKIAGDIEHYD